MSRLLERLATLATSDGVAVADAVGEVTYRELARRAGGVAHALRRGRASLDGARIAILVTPGRDWVASFWGILDAGGVAVPLSPLHPEAEIRYFAADACVEAALVSHELVERAPWLAGARILDPATLGEHERGTVPTDASAVALMLYTSGTTGKPKGASITHDNVATQAHLLREAWEWAPADRLLHALPLHHLHGLGIALVTALLSGASIHMLARFEPRAVWDGMAGATVFMAVPTMYHRLFEAFDAADDATRARWTAGARALRLATSGSAALPVSLGERWRALTGVIPVERFGMTEIGVGMSNPIAGPRVPGSVGRPLPSVSMRVVDEQGNDVEEGTAGEIWVRGPSVFHAYFRREEATREAFHEGWFKTGDTALVDEQGYVRILGRTSVDILKSGGYKLSALEIEEVIRQCEGVVDVAVVGLPDEAWGDRVVAVVIPRAGHDLDAESIRGFAKQHLAPYKVPREVVLAPELPRNVLGKVMKPTLIASLMAR